MTYNLYAPNDLLHEIARKAREKRLTLNFTQNTLAIRSGVSLGVLKKFERTGKISLAEFNSVHQIGSREVRIH